MLRRSQRSTKPVTRRRPNENQPGSSRNQGETRARRRRLNEPVEIVDLDATTAPLRLPPPPQQVPASPPNLNNNNSDFEFNVTHNLEFVNALDELLNNLDDSFPHITPREEDSIINVSSLIDDDNFIEPPDEVIDLCDHTVANIGADTSAEQPSDGRRLECPICMTSLFSVRVHATQCGHLFCMKCIRKCLKNQKVCPVCRAGVQKTFRIYFPE